MYFIEQYSKLKQLLHMNDIIRDSIMKIAFHVNSSYDDMKNVVYSFCSGPWNIYGNRHDLKTWLNS